MQHHATPCSFLILFLFFCFSNLLPAQICDYNDNEAWRWHSDGSNLFSNSNNDWLAGSVEVFVSYNSALPPYISNPYSCNSLPECRNTKELYVVAPQTKSSPSDGWVLLFKELGTSDRPVSAPLYILYNRYTGVVRSHVLVTKTPGYPYTSAEVTFTHDLVIENSNMALQSAIFSYLETPALAVENFTKDISTTGINGLPNIGYNWLMHEFVANYDPCVCDFGSRLSLGVYQSLYQIISLITSGITEGTFEYSTPGPTNTYAGAVTNLFSLGKGLKTYTDLTVSLYSNFLNDSVKKATLPHVPYGKAIAIGLTLIDFLVQGEKQTPAKLIGFKSTSEFTTNGFTQTQNHIMEIGFKNPGAKKQDIAGIEMNYDNPLGVFSLVEIPKLKRNFNYLTQQVSYNGLTSLGNGSAHAPIFFDTPIRYAINPSAGIDPVEMKGAIYAKCDVLTSNHAEALNMIKVSDGLVRTPYMPLGALQFYSMNQNWAFKNSAGQIVPRLLNDDSTFELHVIAVLKPQAALFPWFSEPDPQPKLVKDNVLITAKYKLSVHDSYDLPVFHTWTNPLNNPYFKRENVSYPVDQNGNWVNTVLTQDIEIEAYNSVILNLDYIVPNDYKVIVRSTSLKFEGSNIPGSLPLGSSNILELPIWSWEKYDGLGFLKGYEFHPNGSPSFTNQVQLAFPPFVKFDPNQTQYPQVYSMDADELKVFCREKYNPYVSSYGVASPQETEIKSLVLFPNPAQMGQDLTVKFPDSTHSGKEFQVAILNVLGQSVYQGRSEVITSSMIVKDLQLERGRYFVHIKNGDMNAVVGMHIE
jgi:hypothetical protein